jgi:acyl CoA:acetate/3-ketoacid CoA transferase beta subunit
LAGAAGKVIAALEHRDRSGRPRLVARTELAVAVPRSADLVVTDLGVFLPEGDGFRLVRAAPGVALAEIRAATAAEVRV